MDSVKDSVASEDTVTIFEVQNQKAYHAYNWVVINTKDNDGRNRLVMLEVNENKNNVEFLHWY